jgi:hypothetical protein
VPPFPGGTSKQKIRWQRAEEPPPLEQFNPAAPAELVGLVRVLMAKKLADRPASAEAVREQLLRWAGDAFSRPAGGPAPHSTQETVAAVDAPGSDPELWDAQLVPDEAVEEPEAPSLTPWLFVGAGCVALFGVVTLVLLIGLISRL